MSGLLRRVVCSLPTVHTTIKTSNSLVWISSSRHCPWHLGIRPLSGSRSISTLLLSTGAAGLPKLQRYELYLIPKRDFGRKRGILRYGHARNIFRHPFYETGILLFLIAVLLYTTIDWRFLQREYGIKIFPKEMLDYTHGKLEDVYVDPTTRGSKELSTTVIAAEENADMHAYMKLRALKDKMASNAENDPEIAALIEGREVKTPKDAAEFEAKKIFVNRAMIEIEELEIIAENVHKQSEIKKVSSSQLPGGIFGPRKAKAETEAIDVDEDLYSDDDLDRNNSKYGFRTRKIITYENRIRSYSTPDKIFRYFATIKVVDDTGHQEVMMSPQDFLRSITPGIPQPEELGLDNYMTIALDQVNSVFLGVDEDSIFHQLGGGGLISFSDYIFLLTVLSTSRRHFEIAFKMFDLNGDGNVDAKEFENVTNLMRTQSSVGARHRDHQASTLKGLNSGLISYFFGPNREGILTVDKFLQFQRHLQTEILKLEFDRKNQESSHHEKKSTISEKDFAELLIVYAGFPDKKKAKMLKRVKKTFGCEKSKGITITDYLNFYQVLYAINDIDTALTFYTIAGAPIERSTMQHVAKTVANVELSDHVVDVVFVLFDENGDGKLSNKEFISVMKQRAMRGLEKPKDTGVGKFFSAVTKCASNCQPARLSGGKKD